MDLITFGQYFDHALLKAHATRTEFEEFCAEGIKYKVKMLAVNTAAVAFCKERVEDTPVVIGAAVGFPLGQVTLETKIFETNEAILKGAGEIDYVIDISALKSGNRDAVTYEMQRITSTCRDKNVLVKVIFENCYLTDDEKKLMCEISNKVRPDYIKTSTGFGISGATVYDVKLMRAYADTGIEVKASGGIKTLSDVNQLIEAGAKRIGTSNTAAIVNDFVQRKGAI